MDDEKYHHNRKLSSFNHLATSLGQIKIVAIISLIASMMALVLSYIIITLFAEDNYPILFSLKIAAFIPIIISPVIAWPLVGYHLKSIHLEQELYIVATYDMLTGFLSRNAFFSNLQTLQELAARNQSPLCIASIDIDDFKKINDNYGHAAGDKILKALGLMIKATIRKSDLVGRIGGDEFSLVLPNTAIDEARHLVENIRSKAANTVINCGKEKIQFTLSIGVSQIDISTPVMIDEILIPSDNALYQAKQSGRNCVVMSTYPSTVNNTN